MQLVQLIYTSEARSINGDEIRSILESAKRNNGRSNVSGLLCFSSQRFLQVLEGSASAVNSIYTKILKDDRHEMTILLSYGEIQQRDFVNWRMAYVGDTAINREHMLRYSGSDEFQPAKLGGAAVRLLMLELATLVADTGNSEQRLRKSESI